MPVHANFDREKLEQAQGILLDNALEYAPHGGAITAETNRENGHVRLGFSDTGIGVPREEIPRIFDLAEAHGGTLDVHSAPGKGSTFVLEL